MKRVTGASVVVLVVLVAVAQAAGTGGAIRVTGPAGLRILVDDGKAAMVVPSDGAVVVGATEGRHTVTVELAGEEPLQRVVQVDDGRTVELAWGRDAQQEDALPSELGQPYLAAVPHCRYPELPIPDTSVEAKKPQTQIASAAQSKHTLSRTPPPNPQVGDTWLWYIWDLGGFPVAALKPCTVRGIGPNSYIVVDDDEWNVSIDQADIDRIVNYFEYQSLGAYPDQGIWQLDTSHFGEPPNPLDGLDRIFLLYYRFDIAADGFFWAYDQFSDGTQPFASNEADVVYLATDSGDPSSNYMLAVAAHEFQHMIHYNYDTNENSWVEEGLSELAMWLFGRPDTISSFNTNPDNSLINWGSAWADYIQTYLWTLYVFEQYGGQPTIWDVVHTPANGMAGYLTAVSGQGYSVTMEDVFGDWATANYLDDTQVPNGQYGYSGDTLPPFVPFITHSTYPAAGSGSVQSWATDYIRLTGFPIAPTFAFNGVDNGTFRVVMAAIDPTRPTLVRSVSLDGANDGSLELSEAAGYAEVVVAVASVSSLASSSYSYSCDLPSLLFADGFESAGTTHWSATAP